MLWKRQQERVFALRGGSISELRSAPCGNQLRYRKTDQTLRCFLIGCGPRPYVWLLVAIALIGCPSRLVVRSTYAEKVIS